MPKHVSSIIIPTHQIERNRPGNVVALLKQLQSVIDPDIHQVIVVCNNDNVARELGCHGHDLTVIPGTRFWLKNLRANYGLSAAWNAGLELADGKYCFFVNHDLILTRDVDIFTYMIAQKEFFETRTGLKVFCFGVEGTLQTDNPVVRMRHRYHAGQFTDPIVVDEVSGFLFGISSDLMPKQFFDERLSPCFYEEMDLCQRVRQQNRDLKFLGMQPMVNMLVPGVPYRHDFGASASDPRKTYLLWLDKRTGKTVRESLWTINRRNRQYIADKWGIDIA